MNCIHKSFLRRVVALVSLFVLPTVTFAQPSIKTFLERVTDVVSITIPVVVGLGLLFFLVNTGKLIFHSGDEGERLDQTKKALFWGIIILFVMVAMWGILDLAFSTLFG